MRSVARTTASVSTRITGLFAIRTIDNEVYYQHDSQFCFINIKHLNDHRSHFMHLLWNSSRVWYSQITISRNDIPKYKLCKFFTGLYSDTYGWVGESLTRFQVSPVVEFYLEEAVRTNIFNTFCFYLVLFSFAVREVKSGLRLIKDISLLSFVCYFALHRIPLLVRPLKVIET